MDIYSLNMAKTGFFFFFLNGTDYIIYVSARVCVYVGVCECVSVYVGVKAKAAAFFHFKFFHRGSFLRSFSSHILQFSKQNATLPGLSLCRSFTVDACNFQNYYS